MKTISSILFVLIGVICVSHAGAFQAPPEDVSGWAVAWHSVELISAAPRSVQAVAVATMIVCAAVVLCFFWVQRSREQRNNGEIERALQEQILLLRNILETTQTAIEHQQRQLDELFNRINTMSKAVAAHMVSDKGHRNFERLLSERPN